MNMIIEKAAVTTRSANETYHVGKILGEIINSPLLIAMHGELGVGKTVLVKGAASGLGVSEPVRSPTFTLMAIYEGRLPLYHFDFYRLTAESELEPLGLEEYLEGDGPVFIEWADKFVSFLPSERLDLNLAYDRTAGDDDRRILTFFPHGEAYYALLEKLLDVLEHNCKGALNEE